MHRIKLLGAVGALMFSSLASAQTTFVCGTVACTAFTGTPTGIDDLVVDGNAYDLTFTHTLTPSPFAFSYDASTPGQPVSGVDAGNALGAFYGTQGNPNPGLNYPGGYFVTAYQPSGAPGIFDYDVVGTFTGSYTPTLVAADGGSTFYGPAATVFVSTLEGSSPCAAIACIHWTPINNSAPEISPASALSALTLLVGSILVLRGRRPGQHAA